MTVLRVCKGVRAYPNAYILIDRSIHEGKEILKKN
jgi:hypothetical protein